MKLMKLDERFGNRNGTMFDEKFCPCERSWKIIGAREDERTATEIFWTAP